MCEYKLIQAVIEEKILEYQDWIAGTAEYIALRSELAKLQTLTGFKSVLHARERIKYLRKLVMDFQYTDFGRLLVKNLMENNFKLEGENK